MISLWTWHDSSSYGYCQYCLSQTLVQMFQIGKQADKFSRNCLQVGRSIIANSYFSLRLLLPIFLILKLENPQNTYFNYNSDII